MAALLRTIKILNYKVQLMRNVTLTHTSANLIACDKIKAN